MARQLIEPGSPAIADSPSARGREIHSRYARLDWRELLQLLDDRSLVSSPCEIQFDASPLLPGEFAHRAPKGPDAADGFVIYIHPALRDQRADLPPAILHQLALIEFGPSIGPEQAEAFGCAALGVTPEAYYLTLCRLAEQVSGDELC